MPVQLIIGPPTSHFTRTAAEEALRRNPSFPKEVEVDIQQHEGHWLAAVAVAAEPPFAGGGPADADEEAAGPKSEGPDDTEPSADDSGDEGGADKGPAGPPKEHGEGGEHKEQSELSHLLKLVTEMAAALGIDPSGGLGGGDMIPGPDGPAGPPMPPAPHAGPPTPPPPHGGPPPGGPAGPMGPGGDQHVIHEKAGPPPVPTFASVPDDHPWKSHAVASHFRVAAPIGDQTLAEVEPEVQALAAAGGFTVAKIREEKTADGQRVAAAIIASPKPE